ncbi:MAG: hypothetical protein ACJ8M1_09045 [Chthoniobacterales bacterium]
MRKRVAIYWLIPAQPERELFRELIRILAVEFDAARFQPHLTLCRGSSSVSAAKTLHKIQFSPITLRVADVSQSSKFTQTLIVRFRPDERLNSLVSRLDSRPNPIQNPHLSLLYQQLPSTTRRALCEVIKLPFRKVTFASIAAMSCPSPTETTADVRSWRKIATTRARV